MDDYDIRFVNGNTITYVRRDADAVDFGELDALTTRDYGRTSYIDYGARIAEDDCCVSAIEAVQYHDDATTLDDGHYAVGADTYRVDDLWVIDGVSADRTNQYEADSGAEWKLEIWDDNCTWDSAITTDRSNADAIQLNWEAIRHAFKSEDADEYDRLIKSREENESKEIEDEKGGALDDFLDSFGGE